MTTGIFCCILNLINEREVDMRYRLIASDFDGTIYRSDFRIADGTREAIADYRRAGGTFMVSTGRLYESISKQLPDLGLDDGAVIVEQGAGIVDIRTGETILSYEIDNDIAVRCMERIESDSELIGLIYDGGRCYAESSSVYTETFASIIKVDIHYVGIPMSRYMRENGISPTKLLALVSPDKDKIFVSEYGALYEELSFAMSAPYLMEVVTKDAGKGNALRYVAENIYHIPREDIIAMGDADNDISMIEYAGLGIAMGNAMDSVKAVADMVADTNDNSGVAKIIREYGIGEL